MDVDLKQGLAEVAVLLAGYEGTGDSAQIISGEVAERIEVLASAAVEAISPGVVDDRTPLVLIGAVAQFYLARAAALAAPAAPSEEHPDVVHAHHLLRWLLGVAPDALPQQLRRGLILDAVEGEPDELSQIAVVALMLAQEDRDVELLDHGIGILEALVRAPGLAAERPRLLLNLGAGLGVRFGFAGRHVDLDASIAVLTDALADPAVEAEARLMASSNLSQALRLRWERFGDPGDAAAAEAIGAGTAPALPGDDGPLGQSRTAQFQCTRTGDLAALDESVRTGQAAVEAHPEPGNDRTGALANLVTALRLRFQHTNDARDLMASVAAAREYVAMSGELAEQTGELLSSLCASLQVRFEQFSRGADLDEAIALGRRAVAAYPADHHLSASSLNNLSNALRMRFQVAEDAADLDEAVWASRTALELSGPADANRSPYLNNLSIALQLRSTCEHDGEALDGALRAAAQAVRASRGDRQARDAALGTLAAGIDLLRRRASSGDAARDNAFLQEILGGLGEADVAELNRSLAT